MKLTRKWFTLVEMLIVIVIIGILAAALIPRLTGIQGRARDTARKADLGQISTALSTYQLDNNSYYTWAAAGAWSDATTMLNSFVTNGYLQSAPKDPQGGAYAYSANSTTAPNVFALAAISEGAKKNANWWGAAANLTATWAAVVVSWSTTSPSDVKLCGNVERSGTLFTVPTTAWANCNAWTPMYVLVN